MIGAALRRERSLPAIDRSWEGNGAGVEARPSVDAALAPRATFDALSPRPISSAGINSGRTMFISRSAARPCPFRVIRFAKSVVAVPRCWLLRSWSMLARHGDGDVMTVLTTHNDRQERSNGAKRNGAARVLVTAGALAAHLSCVRSYIAKLVDQGILERRSDGRFDHMSPPSTDAAIIHRRLGRE
jgi:hypothetical protein